jgi:hypothetical protein
MTEKLERKHNRHNVSEIINHDYSKYKNITCFKNENKALYSFILRQNMIDFVNSKFNKNE